MSNPSTTFEHIGPLKARPLTGFRPDDALIFNKAKRQLLDSMSKFQSHVPGAKENELPTSWDDVVLAASAVQTQWEMKAKDSRTGRARELVRKVCNGMNNHATALKMLPTESEYVSLVAGSVLMIIKVPYSMVPLDDSDELTESMDPYVTCIGCRKPRQYLGGFRQGHG